MTVQALLAGVIGIAACVDDLRRRQISNWIPGAAFASGLILQTVQYGWRGVGSALLGTVAGASVFLIFYVLGGMGGGDIKLMAGFGALLGVKRLFEAALWTGVCGGVLAVGIVGAGLIRQFWQRRRGYSETAGVDRSLRQPSASADTIPYAPAIAAGVWLSLAAGT